MSKIVLENVTKRFGDNVAVDNLSLEIPHGAFFSLLGPSGCGKTTTMRLIAGLETPDDGRIWIGDRLVYDGRTSTVVPPSQRGLGMVFQNYALWPHMTVKDNVLFGLQVRRVPRQEREERFRKVQEQLQIQSLENRYPNELSGGQQQRIALARELITNTKVLLMDEPLSNLDAKLRIDMRVELKQLHEATGGTIVYVTHDQIEALTLSTTMAVMKDGVLQQMDTPNRVFVQPANFFVASFMGSAPLNTFDLMVKDGQLVNGTMQLPLPDGYDASEQSGRAVTLAVRPEEVTLQRESDAWTVPGRIESILPMGYTALVRVVLQGDTGLTVEHDTRELDVTAGEELFVRFSPKTIHLFDTETMVRIARH